jgi:acyl carrier protein
MTKEEVGNVVIKHLADAVPDVDVDNIDTNLSMKDLGANSLDIVEIVSRSMRELKVKVPRSALNKLTNLDGLIAMLTEAVAAKASS